MLLSGLVALLFIVGLFFSMLASPPKPEQASGKPTHGK